MVSAKRKSVPILTEAKISRSLKAMAQPMGTARYAAGKALVNTARKSPARVYPYFEIFVGLLDNKNNIICWNAIQALAALARADTQNKIDPIVDRYLAFISGSNLITAANAIQGACAIAKVRPDLIDRIVPALLCVQRALYETPECRNVAIGHSLDALSEIWPAVKHIPEVIEFVQKQQTNTRAPVARRAKAMLRQSR